MKKYFPLFVLIGIMLFSLKGYAKEYSGFTVEEMNPTPVYVTGTNNLRDIPSYKGTYLGTLHKGDMPTVVGKVTNNSLNANEYYLLDNGAFINGGYFSFDIPKSVQLNVKNILQNPELPNGCEVTSLAICLNYKGYEVDKTELADNYLPKTSVWNEEYTAEEYYLGNPRSKGGADSGWYCFASCLGKTIDNYNQDKGTSIIYGNLTGVDVTQLYEEIDNGNPVIVFGTLRWNTPKAYSNGYYSNLHCMVLSGYTDDTVTITDPIYGDKYRTISRITFETVWMQMGSRALVVY